MNFETMNGRLIQSENGSVCANGKWESDWIGADGVISHFQMSSLSLFLSQCLLVSFYFAELKLEARNRNMHKPGAATTTFFFGAISLCVGFRILPSNQNLFRFFF